MGNLISFLPQGLLQGWFVSRFLGRQPRLWSLGIYGACLWCVDFASQALRLPAEAPACLLLYLWARLVWRGSPPDSCAAAVLAVHTGTLSFGVVNSLISLLFPSVAPPAALPVLTLLSAGAAAALYGGCCFLIVRKFLPWGPSSRLFLPLALFFLADEWYLLRTAYGHTVTLPAPPETALHLTLLVLQLLSLAALLSALWAYRQACRAFESQAALSSLHQALHAQQTYVSQAQARLARTRSFRHDLQNHLTVLSGLLHAGDHARAAQYLQKLEAAAGGAARSYRTGNSLVDILLEDKLSGTENVEVLLPSLAGIDDLDLCVLFGNALDNAIQAGRLLGERSGFIRITGERQGTFLRLEFENACPPGPPPVFGTGLCNMRAVAERYGGTLTAERDGETFRLNILISLP